MNAARGQEEDVARTDGVVGQQVGDRVVLDAGGVFGRRHPLGESRAEVRPLVRRHDVPHFGLAFRPVAFPGQLVVRVYLDREVLPCVDELDEQRKLFAEALEVGFSQQRGAMAGDQPGQRRAGLGTFGHDRLVALDARQFPAFAYLFLVGDDPLVGDDLLAAPEHRLENGFELIHIHIESTVFLFCCFHWRLSSWLSAKA